MKRKEILRERVVARACVFNNFQLNDTFLKVIIELKVHFT